MFSSNLHKLDKQNAEVSCCKIASKHALGRKMLDTHSIHSMHVNSPKYNYRYRA